MRRDNMDIYSARWHALITGLVRKYIVDASNWIRVSCYPAHVTSERFLWLHLLDQGSRVRRFAPCAVVAHCIPGPHCGQGWWREVRAWTGSVSGSGEAIRGFAKSKYIW